MFRNIKGQEKAISILQRAVENDKIAHSYIFYGPDGVGKFTTALYFAMALNCHATLDKKPCGTCASCRKFLSFSHPDFLFVFPFPKEANKPDITLGGEIKADKILEEYEAYIQNKIHTPWKDFYFSKKAGIRIASIRMLENRIKLSPNEGNYKVYIIENADMMQIQAANAFLKTLEEPPQDTVIILTTSKPNSLLPTILSRCQKIPFNSVPRAIIEQELIEKKYLENIKAKMLARLANGNMAKALGLADEGKIESLEMTTEFLNILISQNDLKFIDFSNQLKTNKTKALLLEIISNLVIWMSDLSYFKNFPVEIVNLDKTDILETLFTRNPDVDDYVADTIEFLEEMQKKIERNVNQQLVLIEIYHKMNEIFS